MRKKCNIRLRRLALWMLACLTAVCLLPGRAEAGGIATEPGGGAGVLYFKKERDE